MTYKGILICWLLSFIVEVAIRWRSPYFLLSFDLGEAILWSFVYALLAWLVSWIGIGLSKIG